MYTIANLLKKKGNKRMSFQKVLRRNGIKMPKTQLEKIFFNLRWSRAKKAYDELEEEWKGFREELESEWGISPELSFVVNLSFGDCKEAVEEIKKMNLFDLQRKLSHEARKEWIEDVFAEAPDTCSLIVIKGDWPFSASAKALFDEKIHKGYECNLGFIDSLLWVAFRKDGAIPDITNWMMVKFASKVQYI